jgi:hypothetical protein
MGWVQEARRTGAWRTEQQRGRPQPDHMAAAEKLPWQAQRCWGMCLVKFMATLDSRDTLGRPPMHGNAHPDTDACRSCLANECGRHAASCSLCAASEMHQAMPGQALVRPHGKWDTGRLPGAQLATVAAQSSVRHDLTPGQAGSRAAKAQPHRPEAARGAGPPHDDNSRRRSPPRQGFSGAQPQVRCPCSWAPQPHSAGSPGWGRRRA